MKKTFAVLLGSVILTALTGVSPLAAAGVEVNGKWSGGWTLQCGVRDAVTVEFAQDSAGKITGRKAA
jgi:hypothetical protein